jgi:hypothetical protein
VYPELRAVRLADPRETQGSAERSFEKLLSHSSVKFLIGRAGLSAT